MAIIVMGANNAKFTVVTAVTLVRYGGRAQNGQTAQAFLTNTKISP